MYAGYESSGPRDPSNVMDNNLPCIFSVHSCLGSHNWTLCLLQACFRTMSVRIECSLLMSSVITSLLKDKSIMALKLFKRIILSMVEVCRSVCVYMHVEGLCVYVCISIHLIQKLILLNISCIDFIWKLLCLDIWPWDINIYQKSNRWKETWLGVINTQYNIQRT